MAATDCESKGDQHHCCWATTPVHPAGCLKSASVFSFTHLRCGLILLRCGIQRILDDTNPISHHLSASLSSLTLCSFTVFFFTFASNAALMAMRRVTNEMGNANMQLQLLTTELNAAHEEVRHLRAQLETKDQHLLAVQEQLKDALLPDANERFVSKGEQNRRRCQALLIGSFSHSSDETTPNLSTRIITPGELTDEQAAALCVDRLSTTHLSGVQNDFLTFHKYLEKNRCYIDSNSVLGNLSKATWLNRITGFFNTSPDVTDYYYVYFGGHGDPANGNWVVGEMNSGVLVRECIALDEILKSWIHSNGNIKGARLVLLCDCCHAGHWTGWLKGFPSPYRIALGNDRGEEVYRFAVQAAVAPNEYAADSPSFMTKWIERGLRPFHLTGTHPAFFLSWRRDAETARLPIGPIMHGSQQFITLFNL